MAVMVQPTPEERANTGARLARIFRLPDATQIVNWSSEGVGGEPDALVRVELAARVSYDEVNALMNGTPLDAEERRP